MRGLDLLSSFPAREEGHLGGREEGQDRRVITSTTRGERSDVRPTRRQPGPAGLTDQFDEVLDVVLLTDEVVEAAAAVLDARLKHLRGRVASQSRVRQSQSTTASHMSHMA